MINEKEIKIQYIIFIFKKKKNCLKENFINNIYFLYN